MQKYREILSSITIAAQQALIQRTFVLLGMGGRGEVHWAESQSSGHCLTHIRLCVHSSYKQTVRSKCALHSLGLNVFPGCFQTLCLEACGLSLGRKSRLRD